MTAKNPHPMYLFITSLNKQSADLCNQLATGKRLEPSERIALAQQILMIETDRADAVAEILSKLREENAQ